MEKKSDSRSCEFSRLLFNFGSKVKTVEETVNWLLKRSPQCLKLVCQTPISIKNVWFLCQCQLEDCGSNRKDSCLWNSNWTIICYQPPISPPPYHFWGYGQKSSPSYHIWYDHFATSSVFNSCVTIFPLS